MEAATRTACGRGSCAVVSLVHVRAHTAAAAALCVFVSRRETRRVRGGLFRKARLEDGVGPPAEVRSRPEVHGEWQDHTHALRTEPPADDVVDINIGAPEPVDRLLRVAHDKERSWANGHLSPVWRIR